jgi:hypothetical protein
MDAPQWNGADTRRHSNANGKPEQIRCLTCGWRGKGALDKSCHYYQTGHTLIVPSGDPRYSQKQRGAA